MPRPSIARAARITGALLLGAAAAPAAPAAAQTSWRADVAFLDTWRPAVTLAYDWRTPLGGAPPLPGPETPGPIFAEARDWILSARLGAGVTFARVSDSEVAPTAMGQLGVLRRLAGGLEPRVGLYAFGGVNPEVVGPALRFEVKDVAGAQAGWIWGEGGGSGVLVTLDVALALFRDLFSDRRAEAGAGTVK